MYVHKAENRVGRKRKPQEASDEPTIDRIDLRAEPGWVARVQRQAERFGLKISQYVRQAVSKQLEIDEASMPRPRKPRTPEAP